MVLQRQTAINDWQNAGRYRQEKVKRKIKWYEDKNLWRGIAPLLFNQNRIDMAADEVKQIIKLTVKDTGAARND